MLQIIHIIAKLVHDSWKHLCQRLCFVGPADDIGVRSDGCLHLRVLEVNDLAIRRKEIDLLDGRNICDPKLFQSRSEFFVI